MRTSAKKRRRPLTLSGGQFGLIHFNGISISSEMMLIAGQSGQIIIDDGICTAEHNEHFIIRAN